MLLSFPLCPVTKGFTMHPQSPSSGRVSLIQIKHSHQWVPFLVWFASPVNLFRVVCLAAYSSPPPHPNSPRASMRDASVNMAAALPAWACFDPFKWLYPEDFAVVQKLIFLQRALSIPPSHPRLAQKSSMMLPYWHCWSWDLTAFV